MSQCCVSIHHWLGIGETWHGYDVIARAFVKYLLCLAVGGSFLVWRSSGTLCARWSSYALHTGGIRQAPTVCWIFLDLAQKQTLPCPRTQGNRCRELAQRTLPWSWYQHSLEEYSGPIRVLWVPRWVVKPYKAGCTRVGWHHGTGEPPPAAGGEDARPRERWSRYDW